MAVESYRDLTVWQRAKELVELVYKLAAKLPREEKYGLISQLQRAAISIPSNIAEGHARESTKEYLRYLYDCPRIDGGTRDTTFALCSIGPTHGERHRGGFCCVG